MADASNFISRVDPRDDFTKRRVLKRAPKNGLVKFQHGPGNVYFHELTEKSHQPANTGAATDTLLGVEYLTAFSIARSAFFNSTLETQEKADLAMIGVVFQLDHTTTSPDTDAGVTEQEVSISNAQGNAPSSIDANNISTCKYKFLSKRIVEGAAIMTQHYSEKVVHYFAEPSVFKRSDPIKEIISTEMILNKVTDAEDRELAAHTAITTYTIKMTAHAILVDTELLSAFRSLTELLEHLALTETI